MFKAIDSPYLVAEGDHFDISEAAARPPTGTPGAKTLKKQLKPLRKQLGDLQHQLFDDMRVLLEQERFD